MLVWLRGRGLEGIWDRTAPNKPIPGDNRLIVVGVWPSHTPQAYCVGSGPWQASMGCKMALGWPGMGIRPRTRRAAPRHGLRR